MTSRNNNLKKILFVYESLLRLEQKIGILIPLEYIEKELIKSKFKFTKKEIKGILTKLLIMGTVFYPRKDFVARVIAWKENEIATKKWKRDFKIKT